MSEYIKREDAIRAVEKHPDENYDLKQSERDGLIMSEIDNLPSADVVEERHGKWSHDYAKDGIEYNDWFNLHCSVCGETQRDAWGKWNYCPYCGAKMDEEEQEHEL